MIKNCKCGCHSHGAEELRKYHCMDCGIEAIE